VRVVPEIQEAPKRVYGIRGKDVEGGQRKKWGLVSAKFAIRSPVPRSALFLK
jgi:hypothetical protein